MSELSPIPGSEGFVRCYGCGPANPRGLGLRFGLDRGAARVEATFTPDADLAGYRRFVHGGVVATMLDEAMGWALWGLAERVGVTEELVVRYARPVMVGRPYTIVGSIEEATADRATVRAEVRDARGRPAAEGTGRFVFVANDKARDA